MNRRKAATVRRVVPSMNTENEIDDDDDDVIFLQQKDDKMADKPKTIEGSNEVVVAVDIHQVPPPSNNNKDDNQNYIPPTNSAKQVVEVKNKATSEKRNKVSLNAVLARLSPLKRQMKAALSLKAGASKSLVKSATSGAKTKTATLNPILASKIQQQPFTPGPDDIEVLEQNIDISKKGQEARKKKRRPSVKANLAKKSETMKPATKIALKAKIQQKESPQPRQMKDPNSSPVALPPAPGGALIQSSPMNNSSVLGTCEY